MDIKKITKYIIAGLIVIGIGFLVVYFYVNRQIVQEGGEFEEGTITTIFGGLFGGRGGEDVGDRDGIGGGILDEEGKIFPSLRRLSLEPTAGFVSFIDENDEVIVRFIEKATGHIYEMNLNKNSPKRISNTTIPKVYEALWTGDDSLIIRYFDENENVKSFYAEISKTTEGDVVSEENPIEGVFLQNDIQQVVKTGNQIFYLLSDAEGSWGIASEPNGDKKTQIFTSPIREWLVQRPQKGTLAFTTKPSSTVSGYLYLYDVNKEIMNKVLGRVRGLTTLINGGGEKILFSESTDSSFGLNIYDIKEDSSEEIALQTLPEKCVWGSNNTEIYCGVPILLQKGEYPDDWYQGLVSFTDNIWRIDLENHIAKLLVSPREFNNAQIDLVRPSLSFDEKFLFFINKKDSSLWSLELE